VLFRSDSIENTVSFFLLPVFLFAQLLPGTVSASGSTACEREQRTVSLVDYSKCHSLLAVAWLCRSCALKLRQCIPPKRLKTSISWRHIQIWYISLSLLEESKIQNVNSHFSHIFRGPKQFMDQLLVQRPSIMSANELNMEVKRNSSLCLGNLAVYHEAVRGVEV
jgi:hypothetical protein